MSEKRSHFGMAGHYAAMSEFLYRGYNVAMPAVDIGDDVYVVEDNERAMHRLQVKTADERSNDERGGDGMLVRATRRYAISRTELKDQKPNELFFMFMLRWNGRWRFVLIPRPALLERRKRFQSRPRIGDDGTRRPGPKPKTDEEAISDTIGLDITWTQDDAVLWNESLRDFVDCWPPEFPDNPSGPGATTIRR